MNVVKSIVSGDGARRLDFFQRDDGYFGFVELEAVDGVGSGRWTPTDPSPQPICDTLQTAMLEAAQRISWLRGEGEDA